ncbi:ATP-binding cassette transporter [Thecamonas trahens ATCC 50062]|uniref:ATP-binding cassette transporter n=1 Tax=Thecamonas trahens ATCC 50062 TaxID=461836 RepID=A0A0L0D5R1_THETB|nr:ATP-binding cassette transporter [Thecamonas trahens ATCC 50062]KNC46638.1 ATP-binding cassette transporter [Thecamonas trahens ATCC 50062]|eukprot:XP_013760411.1 ATP-binding cassette transporter [Thecamonas trahens ATCC 50062]
MNRRCQRHHHAKSSRALVPTDVTGLRERDACLPLMSQFSAEWEAEKEESGEKASLLRTLRRVFGWWVVTTGLIKALQDGSQVAGPMVLGAIIGWLQDRNSKPPSEQPSVGLGIFYIFLLICTQLGYSIAFQHHMNRMQRLGMRLRAIIINSVFSKSLVMAPHASPDADSGKIVNIISSDAERIRVMMDQFHLMWAGPILIVVAMALLIRLLGPSALAGLLVMVLLVPAQGSAGKAIGRISKLIQAQTDERVKLIGEILVGIRVVKFYAWEDSFMSKVLAARARELEHIRKSQLYRAVIGFTMAFAPTAVSVVTFTVYAAAGNSLDAKVVFPAVALFAILRFPIGQMPMVITQAIDAIISLRRVQAHLLLEEREEVPTSDEPNAPPSISIEEGTFTWGASRMDDSSEPEPAPEAKSSSKRKRGKRKRKGGADDDASAAPVTADPPPNHLSDINFFVEEGELVMIIGPVGSGKSTLLSAILGEVQKVSGRVTRDGTVAYVPQEAWIVNATFDSARYKAAIKAAALEADLEVLPGGDQTEIGERGINLSGGQKQRVSIARALYADRDLILLDDPLSAVDVHVGTHLFELCINGAMQSKTRVLVTHQLQFLDAADRIYVMDSGTIAFAGTHDELAVSGLDIAAITHPDDEANLPSPSPTPTPGLSTQSLGTTGEVSRTSLRGSSLELNSSVELEGAMFADSDGNAPRVHNRTDDAVKGKLVKEEGRSKGSISWSVLRAYATAAGGLPFVALMISLTALQSTFLVGADAWLALWSDDEFKQSQTFYLGIYAAIGVAGSILVAILKIMNMVVSIKASRKLFEGVFGRVLRAPMSFFDTTPMGRIQNRFSKDFYSIDQMLLFSLALLGTMVFQTVAIMVLLLSASLYFIIPLVPVLVVYYFVQGFYRPSSRDLKRLDSTTRSPVYAHFSESLTGVASIRAYGAVTQFQAESARRIDTNHAWFWAQACAVRWLAFRLEMLGTFVVTILAVAMVSNDSLVSPGLAGVALAYAVNLSKYLSFSLQMLAMSEANMNSVERIDEYTRLPQEAAAEVEPGPPRGWPRTGAIEFKNVELRYRPELDPVLKGLSFKVKAGEKIGIVGRTGSGKSTTIQALFRLVELSAGSVVIDGVDIAGIGLKQLRKQMAIIPQDPVLFLGTVRANLDPFDAASDDEVWYALEQAYMKQAVVDMGGLAAMVEEEGANFSVGQRQLLCMARALLRKAKIIVLDEATASVDTETDQLIQSSIRRAFTDDITTLTIAHRLHTIMDSDKILVMDNGVAAQFDSPLRLLNKQRGLFYELVKGTGRNTARVLRALAEGKISILQSLDDDAAASLEAVLPPDAEPPIPVESASVYGSYYSDAEPSAEVWEGDVVPQLSGGDDDAFAVGAAPDPHPPIISSDEFTDSYGYYSFSDM